MDDLEKAKLQTLVEISENGSFAFHCTHAWDTSKPEGIWCIECGEWVLTVKAGTVATNFRKNN